MNRGRIALVVSVNCDHPTNVLHAGAVRVAEILDKSNFETIKIFDGNATGANLYSKLQTLNGAGDSISLVYVVAHGSETALFGSDGKPMFTEKTCRFLHGAIIVANSCLKTGKLPQAYVNIAESKMVKAVVGYSPRLWGGVQRKGFVGRILRLISRSKIESDIVNCSIAPIESLVLKQRDVAGAATDLRVAWNAVATKWFKRDPFLGSVLVENEKAVRVWGDSNAMLREDLALDLHC